MTGSTPRRWPDDADGAVFLKLQEKGFDFSKSYAIDFTVDFDQWPPAPEALKTLAQAYPGLREYVDDETNRGSVIITINSVLDYDLVIEMQSRLGSMVEAFGGWCDSWGVLH
jgi:hypothetical protein